MVTVFEDRRRLGQEAVMSAYASHQGIRYEVAEDGRGAWRWSFAPPFGSRRNGRVVATQEFAITVAQRAIDV